MGLTKDQQILFDKVTKAKRESDKPLKIILREMGIKTHVWGYIQQKEKNYTKPSHEVRKKNNNYVTIDVPPTTAPLSQMVMLKGTPAQIREFLGSES